MTFKKTREYETKKGIIVSEYIHEKTGAKHVHTHVEGIENTFNIVFRTPVNHSKGIPHILEHIVLEGSKKYPVHNMFYRLSGKNFETMMNAGTYNNFTSYYFSANLEEGFFNLADVYLDATLNPLITEASFLQEGFRYEKNEKGELKFSGVVYNEMMAWVGKKEMQLYHETMNELIEPHPLTAYSGGDPYEIADVTYEEIKDYHKKHYNPSNATVFTTGSVSVKKIQEKLSQFFNKFEKTEASVLPEMIFKHEEYFVKKIYHAGDDIVSAMLCINLGEVDMDTQGKLSNTVALADTKVKDYFIQNDNGITLSMMATQIFNGHYVLLAEFQLENESDVDNLWREWNFAWQRVVEEGIDQKIVESYFNKKLANYDAEFKANYSLNLNMDIFYEYMMNNQFYETNKKRSYIERMKEKFLKENVLVETINNRLLNKNKAVLVYSVEDEEYVQKYMENICKKENEVNLKYTSKQKDDLANKLSLLREKEKTQIILAPLPEVLVDESFEAERIVPQVSYETKISHINGALVKNNIFKDEDSRARIELIYQLNTENEEEILFEAIYADLINYTSFKNMDREETNVWKKEGVSAFENNLMTMRIGDEYVVGNCVIATGYKNDLKTLAEKTSQLRTIQDLSDKEGLKKLLSVLLIEMQDMAMSELDSYTTDFSLIKSYHNSLMYLKNVSVIKKLEEMIADLETGTGEVFTRFVNYYNSEKRMNAKVTHVFLDDDDGTALDILQKNLHFGSDKTITLEKLHSMIDYSDYAKKDIALVADTPSAFSSTTMINAPTMKETEDFFKLKVVSYYLTEYATQTIRVKMGAYGAWVSLKNGALVFFSYRTPKPFESIDYYKQLVTEVLSSEIDKEMFEGAKRRALGAFLTHSSKREMARKDDTYCLAGLSIRDIEKKKVQTILDIKEDDVKEVLNKFFNEKTEYFSCVATNSQMIEVSGKDFTKIDFPL